MSSTAASDAPSVPRRLWDYLDNHRREAPARTALVHAGGRMSYAELCREAETLALGLIDIGARAGDTISYQMPNWAETVLIALAAMRIGAICNPIVSIYRNREVSFLLTDARSRFVFMPETYRGFRFADMIAPIARGVGAQMIVCRGDHPDALSFDALLARGQDLLAQGGATAFAETDPTKDALYLYTSGTEGQPKGVRHSQATLLSEAWSVLLATDIGPQDSLFMGSPLTHITGFAYACIAGPVRGLKVCLLDIWDIHEAAQLIAREQCAWTVGATPFLQGLLEDPAMAENIRSLRIFRCGGADVPPSLIRKAQARGIRAMRTYGCSEHPTISGGVGDDPAKAATTDGKVHPQNRVRIADLDDESHILGPGQIGEIQSRGDEVFLGYVDSRLDAAAFTADGWLRTGDLGHLDAENYVTVVGRRKDIIIRKGENISAKEVEDLVSELPQVRQCAVIGVPDGERGEMMVAVCVLESGASLSLGQVATHLTEAGIARQKYPERLEILDAMPTNAAGKIRKVDLRAMFSPPDER
ncbi:MAG: AMP-binding protein [Mesorhizobium sp.]|nr:AMP-binding protein [Mesorhizobium sp.]